MVELVGFHILELSPIAASDSTHAFFGTLGGITAQLSRELDVQLKHMRILKSMIATGGMIGSLIAVAAISGQTSVSTNADSNDDPRLYGTWQESRDAIVDFAFKQNPTWTNWPPEKIEEFKSRFGHNRITYLNGIEHSEFGSAYMTFHYHVLERGTNYVVLRDDDPMNKGHAVRLDFANEDNSFYVHPVSGPVFRRFDKVSQLSSTEAVRPNIYDTTANGSNQISEALVAAAKEHKRVLLQFGANWCGWCHLLHKLFETDQDIAKELQENYEVVMIDVTAGHNKSVDDKYGNPTRYGLPVVVILDSDGKQLTTKNTTELEEGNHHSSQKVLAFLKEWAPKQ